MRGVTAGALAGAVMLAGCGGGYQNRPLVQTEEEAAADLVQYVLSQALSGDVFSACPADTAGERDDACIALVRDARQLESSSEEVQVDASLVEAVDDADRLVVPRAAVTVPTQAADWLADDAEFIVDWSAGNALSISKGSNGLKDQ